jgi:hypothetical protein
VRTTQTMIDTRRHIVGLATALCSLAGVWACAADPAGAPPAPRKYSDGPLVAADFVMPPPKERPKAGGATALAQTFVEIRYTYRYQTAALGKLRQASLTDPSFVATLSRDHSWNSAPGNKQLMAHEQGHFDLGEIFACRAQVKFDKLIAEGAFNGTGPTDEEAVRMAIAAFEAEFRKVLDDMNTEHRRYDADTQHGVDIDRQAQWRRKLDEQLQEAAKSRAPTKPAAPAK